MRELIQVESRRFVLHCLTGLLVVAVHWLLMACLLALGLAPLLATSVGFCAGALTRFLLSRRVVFEPTVTMAHSSFWFVVLLLIQFLLNGLLFSALKDGGLLATWLVSEQHLIWTAQGVTTVVVTTFNFLAYRLWVFR